MKWYWFVVIYFSTFLLGMGVGWLLTRKKVIDAMHNGTAADSAGAAGVQSAIERAKQRIHDLFHRK